MSDLTKKSNSEPTIGQVFQTYFHCDDPERHANTLKQCWLSVLSNLDHQEGNHMRPFNIQMLSEHFLEVGAMAEDQKAPARNVKD